LDGGEIVVVAFVVSGCDGVEVFELVEEPLDGVALSVDPRAERRVSDTVRHWPDISPSAACGKLETDRAAHGIDKRMDFGRLSRRASDPCNGIVSFFLAIGGVLVHADRRAVDHLHVAFVSF